MTVKSKLAILVLRITALPLIGFGIGSQYKTRDILTASNQESLQSVVEISSRLVLKRCMKPTKSSAGQCDTERRLA